MMEAYLPASESVPAHADTVPMLDPGADSGPGPSDTDSSTTKLTLRELYERDGPPVTPSVSLRIPALSLRAAQGALSPVQSPPPEVSVPLPPSPVEAPRDARPGRKAQHDADADADAGSAPKDASVCAACKGGGRNLVVCIDGTSNQFSKKNTNVVELYSRLVKSNDRQLTFYNSGIGTYARPSWRSFSYYKQVIANTLDLAFALRFEKIILGSYEWLADNYVEGDRIFLFGFSRGAYQVRVLSAMIDRVGLIHKGNADQIPFAYELYSHEDAEGNPLANLVFDVLKRVVFWVLYDLSLPQHLWVGWQTAGSSTVMKQLTFWTVIALGFLQWIWSVGRNDAPEPDALSPADDRHDPQAPAPNRGASPVSDASPLSGSPIKERQQAVREMQGRFKSAFARDVKVHFVGAWDTVSSVGLIRDKTLPGTTDGMQHVCYFRHALALHERRVKFLPEFVHGGLGPLNVPGYYNHLEEIRDTVVHAIHEIALGGSDPRTLDAFLTVATALSAIASAFLEKLFPSAITPTGPAPVEQKQVRGLAITLINSTSSNPPHTKEVWFHGSHSDIGGGSSPNERMEKFGPALRWMSFEARLAGLWISKEPRLWDTELVRTSSLSLFWRLFEFVPIKRLTYNGASGTTFRPHLSSKRRVQPGQLVYGGLSERVKAKLCGAGLKIEHDPYLGAEDLLKQLRHHVTFRESLRDEDRVKIDALSSSVLGQQQLRDMKEDISTALVKLLQFYKGNKGDERQSTQDILVIQRLLYGLEYSFDAMVNSRPLYEIFGSSSAEGTWAFPLPVALHKAGIASLVYLSGDEERVVSCDWGGATETWDMSTGQPTGISNDSENIWAISPDGRFAVNSCSDGDALEVLDLESGDVYARLSDPPNASFGTVCSPDCCLVACGTKEGIRLWDIRGRLVRNTTALTTSTTLSSSRAVVALAFSSKGEYLAAGGLDAAIHIWDMNRPDISVGDLVGHTHWVRSVMFSPDDERLVSASYDGTVRIWHKITRDTLRVFDTLHVLSGHLSGVRTAAFSPNGKYVASGSLDLSVRIWDTTTGKLVGVPLNGHTSPIGCVIFSGDGTRVIAGAKDGTVRIWDRMPAVPFVGRNLPPSFPVLVPAVGPIAQQEVVVDTLHGASLDAVRAAATEDDIPAAAAGSQTLAATSAVGPEMEAPADAPATFSAPRLFGSVSVVRSSEGHDSPNDYGARAAAVGVANTTTAMVAGFEDTTDASPPFPAVGSEELAKGARETTRALRFPLSHNMSSRDWMSGGVLGGPDSSDWSQWNGIWDDWKSPGPESLVGGYEQGADVALASHIAEPEDAALEPVAGAMETVPGARAD